MTRRVLDATNLQKPPEPVVMETVLARPQDFCKKPIFKVLRAVVAM